MVKPTIQKHVSRKKATRHNLQVSQMIINAVLWQIIREQAEDKEQNAILTVPLEEMKDVPVGFKLVVNQGKEEITIKATSQEQKKIITPELYTG